MTRKDALKQVNEWYVGTVREHSHWKLINKIYDDFEFEMECYKQCQHQLALCETALDEADRQLDNLNINLEAQEIMIADYKKRIEEYEHMIDWMESNSNSSLHDYYNREEG